MKLISIELAWPRVSKIAIHLHVRISTYRPRRCQMAPAHQDHARGALAGASRLQPEQTLCQPIWRVRLGREVDD